MAEGRGSPGRALTDSDDGGASEFWMAYCIFVALAGLAFFYLGYHVGYKVALYEGGQGPEPPNLCFCGCSPFVSTFLWGLFVASLLGMFASMVGYTKGEYDGREKAKTATAVAPSKKRDIPTAVLVSDEA